MGAQVIQILEYKQEKNWGTPSTPSKKSETYNMTLYEFGEMFEVYSADTRARKNHVASM